MPSTATRLAVLAALTATASPAAAQAAPASPAKVECDAVAVQETHGGPVRETTRLTPIRAGRVVAMDPSSGATRTVRFSTRAGRWLTSTTGERYAVAGQAVGPRTRPLILPAPATGRRRVACAGRSGARAFASDAPISTADTPMVHSSVIEVGASTTNRVHRLVNVPPAGDPPACTNTATHPDGAAYFSNPKPGVWCFKGPGQWLTDITGKERYSDGSFINDWSYHHEVFHNGYYVPASKRPSARSTGEILVGTAIAWRIALPVKLFYPASFNPYAGR